ncbi:hypothetical protein HanIR_Chr04g0195371 [Helianthus annuus]|nr:hypothetical protein HanIR_Chr04g0195371 [Helianthus annuus]
MKRVETVDDSNIVLVVFRWWFCRGTGPCVSGDDRGKTKVKTYERNKRKKGKRLD